MNLDDLKHGLTTLADEMEPFEGNVRALHRRERRRRVAVSSIAALVVVAIAVATVAITRNGDSGKIHVAGVPSKEVSPAEITHIDVIVVPATPAVKAALDASPLVGQYALVPAKDRSSGQGSSAQAIFPGRVRVADTRGIRRPSRHVQDSRRQAPGRNADEHEGNRSNGRPAGLRAARKISSTGRMR